MMEERVARLRGEIGRIKEGRERVGGMMRGLAEGGVGSVDVMGGGNGEGGEVKRVDGREKERARQGSAWAAIEQEVGSITRAEE
jgi:hypothetical protein